MTREKSDLDSYQRYLLAQIKELITNYGPLLTIWNDVPQKFQGRGAATIKMVRELQPDILINSRTGDGGETGSVTVDSLGVQIADPPPPDDLPKSLFSACIQKGVYFHTDF